MAKGNRTKVNIEVQASGNRKAARAQKITWWSSIGTFTAFLLSLTLGRSDILLVLATLLMVSLIAYLHFTRLKFDFKVQRTSPANSGSTSSEDLSWLDRAGILSPSEEGKKDPLADMSMEEIEEILKLEKMLLQ